MHANRRLVPTRANDTTRHNTPKFSHTRAHTCTQTPYLKNDVGLLLHCVPLVLEAPLLAILFCVVDLLASQGLAGLFGSREHLAGNTSRVDR